MCVCLQYFSGLSKFHELYTEIHRLEYAVVLLMFHNPHGSSLGI